MYNNLSVRLNEALKHIQSLDHTSLAPGKYIVNDDFFYIVQEYNTKEPTEGRYEVHKKYIDIQYIASGKERIDITAAAFLQTDEPYNESTDVCFLKDPKHAASVTLGAGNYVILYPQDAHKPGLKIEASVPVKKILAKVHI